MKNILQKIDRSLYQTENVLVFLILGMMVVLSFLQVLLRNFFDTGILWADILLRHLVLWVGFIGAALATRTEKHINIDLLSRIVSKRYLLPVKIVTRLFAIIICAILTRASYLFLMSEKEAATIVFKNIPGWYLQIIIPVGFLLIGVRFLLKILEDLTGLTSPQKQEHQQ
jgi:TRAP-type C4-dicarboxylate transport system permease small subunit